MMKKISLKQPSYFEGMDIDDELTIISRDNVVIKFIKTSDESCSFSIRVGDTERQELDVDYDFKNFPTIRDKFIKKIRYVFLKDFGNDRLRNDDLKDTMLNLVSVMDLGYGVRIKKIKPADIPKFNKEMSGSTNRFEDEEIRLPEGYLEDFIYAVYVNDKPMGIFNVPFSYADEIYDFNDVEDIRDFLTDLAEQGIGARLKDFVKMHNEDNKIETTEGEVERPESEYVNSRDIFNFYNEKIKKLSPDSNEYKKITKHINGLIERINEGEDITRSDLEIQNVYDDISPREKPIQDYRKMILLTKLERDIFKVDHTFDEKIKSETDENKIYDIKSRQFSMMKDISDLKVKMEGSKNIQPVLNEIYKVLESASDFIKK